MNDKPNTNIDEPIEDSFHAIFAENKEMETSDVAAAARRLEIQQANRSAEVDADPTPQRGWTRGQKLGATAAVAATAVFGATVVGANQGPEFSDETKTYTVESGDGLQNAAEDILGTEKIDIRDAISHIADDPANIDVLKDGLQPGETLVIPDHVEE